MTSWTTARIGPAPVLAVDHQGAGELVLFLHGIGGNKRNWHPQLPAFAAEFLAVAWDARGYGESDDYEGPLRFADYADDIPRVLDHFGAPKAHIVGLSMGGRIAMDFAHRFADRVRSLTLCDTHLGFQRFTPAERAEFVRLRREPLMAGKEPRDIALTVAKSLAGPNVSKEAFDALVDSLSRLHKESYIKSVEANVDDDPFDTLHLLTFPTLVVVGEHDRLTPPAMAREIAGQIDGAGLVVIPDAGHLSNIEQPEAFKSAVLGFLRSQRAG